MQLNGRSSVGRACVEGQCGIGGLVGECVFNACVGGGGRYSECPSDWRVMFEEGYHGSDAAEKHQRLECPYAM